MDPKEYRLQLCGILIALVGVLGALGGGTVAYLEYRSKAELGALRALHDAQLATCRDASQAAAHLLSSSSQSDFDKALSSFAEIKHGSALTLLDKPVLDQMVKLYSQAYDFDSPDKGGDFRAAVATKLGNEPFKVAMECRKMLVRGYKNEVGSKIQFLDDSYVMQWAPAPH